MDAVAYADGDHCVRWSGIGFAYGEEFEQFLHGPAASRLNDKEC
ncbi:hypothetical protein [Microbulbifer sp. THAF38]|nr:hypothetical protein [Microbulbifer sp. THAF38]QFT53765.1 hypothetical protein FIU95_04150 [Microbulbifer sp. THAF38]